MWGPALKAAKDAAGQWTGAAQGFARKNGVAPEALGVGVKDAAKPDEKSLALPEEDRGSARRPRCWRLLLPALLRGFPFRSA